MDNKRAIEVLQLMLKGTLGFTAVDREDAIDHACAVLREATCAVAVLEDAGRFRMAKRLRGAVKS
jgi:hypothetical protein